MGGPLGAEAWSRVNCESSGIDGEGGPDLVLVSVWRCSVGLAKAYPSPGTHSQRPVRRADVAGGRGPKLAL